MKPWNIVAAGLLGFCSSAFAAQDVASQPSAPSPDVAAAADARDRLGKDVWSAPFVDDISVGQITHALGADDSVARAIAAAERRGGPRWRDGGACEVRLELPGPTLAKILSNLSAHVRQTLVTPRKFEAAIARLQRQTFSAVGIAGPAAASNSAAPILAPAWQNVTEAVRSEALQSAKLDAAARVLDELRSSPIGDGKTMADAFAVPEVSKPLQDWLLARPATGVQYRADLEVHVTLSAEIDELWPLLGKTLRENHLGPPEADADAWKRLKTDISRALTPTVGRGVADPARGNAEKSIAELIPRDAPQWAGAQMDADGDGAGGGLKGARAAEAVAISQLRHQVDALVLAPGLTLGEASKRDPRIAKAIGEIVEQNRVSRVTYRGDRASVRVSLDLELVWRAIAAGR